MNKEELIKKLNSFKNGDPEIYHEMADKALLEYINDKDISDAFDKVVRWYA